MTTARCFPSSHRGIVRTSFLAAREFKTTDFRFVSDNAGGGGGNNTKDDDDDEDGDDVMATNESWSEEWRSLKLGARKPSRSDVRMTNLLFAQTGFGVDQHGGGADATKAAVRAVRNAIEFNAIPAAVTAVPGGRSEMLVHVKIGAPPVDERGGTGNGDGDGGGVLEPLPVDVSHVAKVFPYGRLLPVEVVVGGLSFPTGRIVRELGDTNDAAVCCAACVSIGYDDGDRSDDQDDDNTTLKHKTYDTRDGY